MTQPPEDVFEQAVEVLRTNDRGGYTVPTDGLYPFQWNWDSAFAALGFAQFDTDRAWQEVESLFDAQWPNGMVPHIIFRVDEPSYFPGPSVWQADHGPLPSSGITQPPVAATVIRRLGQADPERAAALVPQLDAWHRWFHEARDPDDLGIIAITHPWESGRDNLPDWDAPAAAVDTSQVGEYTRRDTSLIDADMRPGKAEYDRYLALVQAGIDCDWDAQRIAAESPFFVADVGMTAILLRAERDLLAIIERARTDAAVDPAEVRARIQKMEAGFELLWNPAVTAYCSLDLRADERASTASSASFLAWYAGITEHHEELLAELTRYVEAARFAVPSFDPDHELFNHIRYWRGPVWAVMNWMIAAGLQGVGQPDWYERIRADTMTLIETSGFAEYFSPLDGRPCGGATFTWTAAIWLAFSRQSITVRSNA